MTRDARFDPMEEPPRQRRRHTHRHVKADHKHDYELVCIDSGMVARFGGHSERIYEGAERCRVCGRIGRYRLDEWRGTQPEGLRRFKTDCLMDTWVVPDEKEVTND